jgi:predicted nucleic acid-binding protein
MILYLETSNLVKLYAEEADSAKITASVREADVVATAIISYAEARAAFSRKFREKDIGEKDYLQIKKDLETDWESYFVLFIGMVTVKSAGDLAEKYGLRGFDALHLASALELKGPTAGGVKFSTSDARLGEAAAREGLAS